MSQNFLNGILMKKMIVKKAPMVQGQVCIHFPNPAVQDIILKDYSEVDVFQRINITADDVKTSNISQLLSRGDIVLVGK